MRRKFPKSKEYNRFFQGSTVPPHASSSVSEKAYEAKAMAEQGVAMAKDKCKVQ